MKKGYLVCFTGIDGSGKTTLAKSLVRSLKSRGIASVYVYGRVKPVMLRPFVWFGRLVFMRGKDMFDDYTEYSKTKRRAIRKHHALFGLYCCTLWIDYVIQISFKVCLPLLHRQIVVCDRYVYDTVITDLATDMDYSTEQIVSQLRRVFRFVPRPDIVFLVDAPEEVAYRRKDDHPSIKYLKERRQIYLDVSKYRDISVLDGTLSPQEIEKVAEEKVLLNWPG